MNKMFRTPWLALVFISVCLLSPVALAAGGAPGAPGAASFWTYAGKTGIGTSYEAYQDQQYRDGGPTGTISRVWFSIAQGIVTETAYGRIDRAQIRDMQFLITGHGFFDEEKRDTHHQTDYLYKDGAGRPLALSYRLVNTDKDGRYSIEKHLFTDPDRQTLFMHVVFTAHEDNVTPYLLINPHMKNTGRGDVAYVSHNYLNAREGYDRYLSVRSNIAFVKSSAGFVGVSDGWQDLNDNRVMDWTYEWADDGGGDVAMMAQLPTVNAGGTLTFDVAVGVGDSHFAALGQADGSLSEGYAALLAKYHGQGSAIGWEDYLSSLTGLPSLVATTTDNGRLLYVSAMVLKALEDKENAGALIASLSIPWGETVSADVDASGYRAVWPRDFYQCAMALLALGDTETPRVAFAYLRRVQVTAATPGNTGSTGWFLQKTRVNGELEWVKVQLDQTAMPIMLGWKLWKANILSDTEVAHWYAAMLKPAAEFLANGGIVRIQGHSYSVIPPGTELERWEEQHGHSPSTTAAVIAGLVVAADIARHVGDPGAAAWYEAKADIFAADVERIMFTTTGPHTGGATDGEYFLRITQNDDPNDGGPILASNGRRAMGEQYILDAGFLELVRYGVRDANDPFIDDSFAELDDVTLPENLKLKYVFRFDGPAGPDYPGWRRYGNDGYGEREDSGGNWVDANQPPDLQRGRVWPFLTGERGHYELERLKAGGGGTVTAAQLNALRQVYVRAMEHFANEGAMLPEQVWDGVGSNAAHGYALGEGTNSATPLAWTHAEYVKLVRSIADRNTWDSYAVVRDRYSTHGRARAVPQVFLRGTHNNWGVSAMRLVADHTWRIEGVIFAGVPEDRCKFDIYGDWSHNYGDQLPGDGTADRAGADIPVTAGPGSYTITFNDSTKAYLISKN
jgi:glucoamylase